jgi:3-hydroxybutyryl-CoA dehydrogenase
MVTVVGATGSAASLASLAAVLARAKIDLIALTDVAGLVVMRTIAGLVNEAADLMTWTATSATDIDTSMRLGTAYALGPLAWADLVGPARVVQVLSHLQRHYGDARYRRAPRLSAACYARETFHG